ncbi:phosphocarrier protein HPr [Oceanobacillus bengalensis]|uniref:Phosphocarrier protein HPr n=1 Tax=Oceanobacillus bengalensis TaxID=1435466 RepID=A0A494Z7M4_9BACI|nr:phosphocarrier protein HPr [Oceanobacillus bengalensis]RKQ18593.1 phosphocarrier protein HPr [Oceanobacillus bengalensis]
MVEKEFTIIDKAGIHARPATVLVQAVANVASEVYMTYNEKTVNLKSIMGIMSLGITHGAKVKVTISGSDENETMENLSQAMKNQGLAE